MNRAKMRTAAAMVVIATWAAGTSLPARANVGEAFGFGSQNSAMAGAGAAGGASGFEAYFNPAALALNHDRKVSFSWAFIGMRPIFLPIDGVVTENTYTSDKISTGNVGLDYRSTYGQALGLGVRLLPEAWNLSLGLTTYLPADSIAYLDTGSTFVPEYPMYRARTQRPQFNLGLAAEPVRGFAFGIGTYVGFAMTAKAEVFLQTDPNKPSTMRFLSSLKPKAAPYLGLVFNPMQGPWTGALVWRAPLNSANYMTLQSGARAFGSLAALDFHFDALSSLYYDPMAIEIGNSVNIVNRFKAYAQFDYQYWSRYKTPSIEIQDPAIDSCSGACGVTVSKGSNPAFEFKDILVPRIGGEAKLSDGPEGFMVRAGYAFRPSILKSLPTGVGNYVDPPKDIVTAGVGYIWEKIGTVELPVRVDAHFAFHRLHTQKVTKSSDTEIGAPGYSAGGKVFGGGLSLSVDI